MTVQIKIDQAGSGAPAGVAGESREDLSTGFPVLLTAVGGPFLQYQWTLIDKAVDIVTPALSAAALSTPTASSTICTPIDKEGTYFAEVAVDAGFGLGARPEDIARATFYAGPTLNNLSTDPAELPRREPAFRERTEHNVADAIFALGNTRGWAQEWLRWFQVIRRIYSGKSWGWGRIAFAGGVATVTDGFNVSAVTVLGLGNVRVDFVRKMPNTSFAVIATARGGTGGSCTVTNEAVGSFQVWRADPAGALVDADFTFDVRATA